MLPTTQKAVNELYIAYSMPDMKLMIKAYIISFIPLKLNLDARFGAILIWKYRLFGNLPKTGLFNFYCHSSGGWNPAFQ